jgi:adenylosuccinate lyase
MHLNELTAISPVDGRYRGKITSLAPYLSEYGLIRYRVRVEVEYFISLVLLPLPGLESFPHERFQELRNIYLHFSEADALRIKEIETITNHDVKSVEYFLREQFNRIHLKGFDEFIHFGLTSQDVNNTATPLSLMDALNEAYYPLLNRLIARINELSTEWSDVPMLARTHGQPASPTRLGKEMAVFSERLSVQKGLLLLIPYSAKFGGATGNFNAHHVAYPQIDWVAFANAFVNGVLGLERSQTTTQIDHYDNLAALFDGLKRINTILLDFNRDIWTYISMDYFRQKIRAGEVGSSAMPHKVNPIDFENAEGNLGLANALFEHLSAKLPVSRLQRDLTDSTVLRNTGVPLAHTILAIQSTLKGLDKLILNRQKLDADLTDNWMVVAEAIQTILRRENYPDPYEALKQLTRTNEKVTRETFEKFIDSLVIGDEVKRELRAITPFNYTGI